jgi:hypothetical protein
MKHRCAAAACAVVLAAVSRDGRVSAETPSPRELVETAYEQERVPTMRIEIAMTIVDGSRQWQRTATLESKKGSIGTQVQRFTFRSPADLDGSSVLTQEQDGGDPAQWVYIPAYHTARRIAASQRGEAYLGTDYFYEDVLDRQWDRYRYQSLGSETVDGRAVAKVEAVPTSDALKRTSPYSRIVYFIDGARKVVLREEYYDLSGKLVKRLANGSIKAYGRYLLSDEALMENLQTGHRTISRVTRRDVDAGIADEVFTVRALKRPH